MYMVYSVAVFEKIICVGGEQGLSTYSIYSLGSINIEFENQH